MTSYKNNWQFMLDHMPAVREALCELPACYFLDFATADPKRDMEEATDLVLKIAGGTMAVRIRRKQYKNYMDWTIRYKIGNNDIKTEIHKLKEGFADWYFYGYSADDVNKLDFWCLIDLYRIREEEVLDKDWSHTLRHNTDNRTSFISIPIKELFDAGTLIFISDDIFASMTHASDGSL